MESSPTSAGLPYSWVVVVGDTRSTAGVGDGPYLVPLPVWVVAACTITLVPLPVAVGLVELIFMLVVVVVVTLILRANACMAL